jgi:nucleoid-associated protein YgaU
MPVPQPNATTPRWLPVAAAALATVITATGLPFGVAAVSALVNQNAAAWCDRSSTRIDNEGTTVSGPEPSMLTAGIAVRPACDTYAPDGRVSWARSAASADAMTPPVVLPQRGNVRVSATTPKPPELAIGSRSSSQSTTTYSVRLGDCLSDIAASHNIADWQQLYAVNRRGISNPDLIYPGQLLRLPTVQIPQ